MPCVCPDHLPPNIQVCAELVEVLSGSSQDCPFPNGNYERIVCSDGRIIYTIPHDPHPHTCPEQVS